MQTQPARFADSTEATEFVEQLQKMLQDPRLVQWCKSTDHDFGTESTQALFEARQAFCDVNRELEKAC